MYLKHPASNPMNGVNEGPFSGLRFSAFELDVRSGELRRNGSLVRIQPQPFKVLVLLASRPGEVVTREEIQAEVWPAGTFVDFEQSLNFCVRQIRSALGDNALAPRYIETLPRRGYRWVGGPVEKVGAPAEVREWPRPVPPPLPQGPQPEAATEPDAEPAPVDHPHAPQPARGLLPAHPPPALPEIPAPAMPRRRALPLLTLALAVVALAAGGLAAWLLLRPVERPSPPEFQRLTFRRGAVTSARFAPEGQIVYTAAWEGQPPRGFLTRSDPRDFRPLELPPGEIVGVSASGEVAFLRDGVLARAPLAGGPPKEVLREVAMADWTADGAEFAVLRSREGRLMLEFPVGRALAEVRPASWLRIAPDRSAIALVEHTTPGDDRGDVVIRDRAGKQVAVSRGWGSVEGLAWSPRGEEAWFTAAKQGADTALYAMDRSGAVRTVLTGTGRLVVHDIAPDGRVLLERANLRMEMLHGRRGESETRDLSWLDFTAGVGLSRDGRTVLFYESGEGGGPEYATFVRGVDGSPPVRVGTGRACDLSPDGQWTLSIDLRRPDAVQLSPVGPGEPRLLKMPGGLAHEYAGFVDERTVFVATRDPASGEQATWLVGTDGKGARRLQIEQAVLAGSPFSLDGRQMVVRCRKQWCLQQVAGGAPEPLRGADPSWRRLNWDASGGVFFIGRGIGEDPPRLLRLDTRTAKAETVASLVPRDRAGFEGLGGAVVASDGGSWVFNVRRRLSDLHVVTHLQ